MVIVSNDFRTAITSMSHEQIEAMFASGQDCGWFSGGDESSQKTHWHAEPSVMRAMSEWCADNSHRFEIIKGRPL